MDLSESWTGPAEHDLGRSYQKSSLVNASSMKSGQPNLINLNSNARIPSFVIPIIMLLTGCVRIEPFLNSEVFLQPEINKYLSREIGQDVACIAGRKRLNSPQEEPRLEEHNFYVFLSGRPTLQPAQIGKAVKDELKHILGKDPKKISLFWLRHVSGGERSFNCQELMKMQDESP